MRVDAQVTEGRSLAWPLATGAVAALLLFGVAAASTITTAMLVGSFGLLSGLSFFALMHMPRKGRGRYHRVGADARGLSVDGQLVLPRQNILRARVRDEPDGTHSVIVEAKGLLPGRIVHVASPRIAQALADTLEQSPQRVIEFDALPPWAHRMRGLTVVMTTFPWILLSLVRHMTGSMVLVVLGLYGLISLPILLPQKVAIGEDGVLLRWAGRRRFIPYSRLRSARPTPLGIQLELDGDGPIEIRITHRSEAEAAKRAAMIDRIEEGLAHHRALAPAEDEALLSRGERDLDAWIEDMHALGTADACGYRAIAIPRERLWAVVENPSADPSARQGAAIALRARLDDEERERLVSIAQKSASPRLRVALDAVASTSDTPKLRVALETSEQEEEDDTRAIVRERRSRR